MRFSPLNYLLFAVFLLPYCAVAQDLSPRAYWPSPVGTRVATFGYSYLFGDIVPDRSLPITGVDSTINSLHLGYRQTFNLMDRTANITFELPYSSGDTVGIKDDGENLKREYDGVGDLGVTLSANLLGAPAMNREEFVQLRHNLHPILGGSVKIVAPTGRYNPNRLINVGATLVFPINKKRAVKLGYANGSLNDSDEAFNTFQISLQQVF